MAVYEIGQVFAKFGNETDNRPTELPQVAIAMTGKGYDFYAAKGVVEICSSTLTTFVLVDQAIAELHPGRTRVFWLMRLKLALSAKSTQRLPKPTTFQSNWRGKS